MLSLLSVVAVANGSSKFPVFSARPPPPQLPDPCYFSVPLDHSNSSLGSFPLRYYTFGAGNCTHMSGPVMFYTGNEGPVTSYWDDSGWTRSLAQVLQGTAIFVEHRYFGTSLPFGDDSFTRDNLKYLTVEAALADYASLMSTWPADTQIITVGGSYGGMLSGWMRLAYPHLVDGAIAASAPYAMLDRDNWVGHPSYFQSVTDNFAVVNPECVSIAQDGFEKIAAADNATLRSTFNFCANASDVDLWTFMQWIQTSVGTSLGMGNNPWPGNWMAPLPAWPAVHACEEVLLPNRGDSLTAVAKLAHYAFFGNNTGPCVDIASEYKECSDATGCGAGGPGAKAWDWLACSSLFYAPNTDGSMFPPDGWNKATRDAYCETTWGIHPDSWKSFAKRFGLEVILSKGSRIYLSNFVYDPWHGGGIMESVPEQDLIVNLVDIGGHHADLWEPTGIDDPPALVAVHEEQLKAIRKWIA